MLRAREQAGERTGILFGRERFGLDNAEVALADEIVTFPVEPSFASLNIAQAVLFLCGEESSFITGQVLVVDGGMSRLMIYHQDDGWTYQP